MPYTRVNWQDDPSTATPTSAANFNVMDLGIDQAIDLVDRFDQSAMAAATNLQPLTYDTNTNLFKPRTQLSTDFPNQVRKTVSGTTYTILDTDWGKLIEFTAATAVAVTWPTGLATGGFSDTFIDFCQYGAGQVTNGGTATLNSRGGTLKSAGTYAEWRGRRRGTTDEYILSGDLVV